MIPARVQLLKNATATGSPVFFPGGIADFEVVATFNGGTIALQKLGPDEATYLPVTGASVTANGIVAGLNLPAGVYQATVTGGPPAAAYATLCAAQN